MKVFSYWCVDEQLSVLQEQYGITNKSLGGAASSGSGAASDRDSAQAGAEQAVWWQARGHRPAARAPPRGSHRRQARLGPHRRRHEDHAAQRRAGTEGRTDHHKSVLPTRFNLRLRTLT